MAWPRTLLVFAHTITQPLFTALGFALVCNGEDGVAKVLQAHVCRTGPGDEHATVTPQITLVLLQIL